MQNNVSDSKASHSYT